MRKFVVGMIGLVVAGGAALALSTLSGFERVPAKKPQQHTALVVETHDLLVTSQIMQDVQQMLHDRPAFQQAMRAHGALSDEGYAFQFTGTCAAAQDLIAAITAEVRKTTTAPVRCIEPA
jgi:hypothetical protein